jgi:hypothetical protein
MKPLFPVADPQGGLPLFAYGQILQGQPLAWAMGPTQPVQARLRGRLWRLPAGTVLLSLDPRAGWVLGELYTPPPTRAVSALPTLLGAPGLEPGFERARARVGMRALLVQAWAAPEDALRKAGARALKTGNWRRVAPR